MDHLAKGRTEVLQINKPHGNSIIGPEVFDKQNITSAHEGIVIGIG